MSDLYTVDLFINGRWRPGRSGGTKDVHDPATDSLIATVACADQQDLDESLDAAAAGFAVWRSTSAFERGAIMRRAAGLVRERAEDMALLMSREQGKPLVEARGEIASAAEIVEWFAEEGRRAYGRVIPARQPRVHQLSLREPVGPVAAFTPWNFPIN